MKISLLPILALVAALPTLALPEPIPAPAPEALVLEKRSVTGTVTADWLRYRTCPRTSCSAVGQYEQGTKLTIVCEDHTDTTLVNAFPYWGKLKNDYWVSLYYVDLAAWPATC